MRVKHYFLRSSWSSLFIPLFLFGEAVSSCAVLIKIGLTVAYSSVICLWQCTLHCVLCTDYATHLCAENRIKWFGVLDHFTFLMIVIMINQMCVCFSPEESQTTFSKLTKRWVNLNRLHTLSPGIIQRWVTVSSFWSYIKEEKCTQDWIQNERSNDRPTIHASKLYCLTYRHVLQKDMYAIDFQNNIMEWNLLFCVCMFCFYLHQSQENERRFGAG